MRSFVALAAGAVLLAGCESAQIAALDSGIQSTLGAVCPVAAQAHAAFMAANISGKFNKYADDEAQAYAAISVACANPSSVNSTNVLIYVAMAYAAWDIAGVR